MGKTSAFTGNSGVGKSTLLNMLFPNLSLATGEISDKLGRGRHTTRAVELFNLDGCYIADTPGFSTVDLQRYEIIDKDELQYCFPNLKSISENVCLLRVLILAKKAAEFCRHLLTEILRKPVTTVMLLCTMR